MSRNLFIWHQSTLARWICTKIQSKYTIILMLFWCKNQQISQVKPCTIIWFVAVCIFLWPVTHFCAVTHRTNGLVISSKELHKDVAQEVSSFYKYVMFLAYYKCMRSTISGQTRITVMLRKWNSRQTLGMGSGCWLKYIILLCTEQWQWIRSQNEFWFVRQFSRVSKQGGVVMPRCQCVCHPAFPSKPSLIYGHFASLHLITCLFGFMSSPPI